MIDIFKMIDSYDGMLIETGGNFGRGKLGGDTYADKCCMAAKDYILNGGSIEDILTYLDKKIEFYESEKEWIFQDMELNFLSELKENLWRMDI